MEPDLGLLELKLAVWTLGNPNFAQNRLEPKGGTLTQKQAPKTKVAVKKAFWDQTLQAGPARAQTRGLRVITFRVTK